MGSPSGQGTSEGPWGFMVGSRRGWGGVSVSMKGHDGVFVRDGTCPVPMATLPVCVGTRGGPFGDGGVPESLWG